MASGTAETIRKISVRTVYSQARSGSTVRRAFSVFEFAISVLKRKTVNIYRNRYIDIDIRIIFDLWYIDVGYSNQTVITLN